MYQAVHNNHGGIVIDGRQVADTLQCCHCGGHWVPVKGSGKVRGFCMLCNKVHCGSKECSSSCTPFEKRMEQFEAGKRRNL
jgi:hypothetical protein